MPAAPRRQTSRQRFKQYRESLAERRRKGTLGHSPDAPPPKKRARSFFSLLRAFLAMLHGQWRSMAFALTCLTISTLILLVPPAAPKFVVDYILGDKPLPTDRLDRFNLPHDKRSLLAVIAVALVVFSSISVLISMLGRWRATRIAVNMKPAIRRDLFDHAMRLPLHRVYQLKTGGTSSILREDTGSIGDLVFGMIYNPWRAILQVLGSLAIMAWVDWRLLAGALILLPTVWLTHRTWISRIRPLYRDIHLTRQAIDSHTTEAFGGIRVVRGFGRQRSESSRFIRNDQFRARQEVHVWWWARAVDIAWALIIPAASAALIWYGGTRVLDGSISVGDLVMFLTYLTMLLDPVAMLAQSATQLQTGLAALDRVLDLLAEPQEMPRRENAIVVTRPARSPLPLGEGHGEGRSGGTDSGGMAVSPVKNSGGTAVSAVKGVLTGETPVPPTTVSSSPNTQHLTPHTFTPSGRITLRNVTFTYPGTSTPVLKDINLDVNPGEMIALVGPSGAGKTTLCNLIARFYDPDVIGGTAVSAVNNSGGTGVTPLNSTPSTSPKRERGDSPLPLGEGVNGASATLTGEGRPGGTAVSAVIGTLTGETPVPPSKSPSPQPLTSDSSDASAGSISLDGIDLRDLDVNSYRRLTGIVEQDIFLFDGTVAENIGYASREPSTADIIRAATLANAHEFITKFEKGYDTIIGERGVKLSGGQRQRLAIARALLADPLILILDEATSNLDTESERLIQQSLRTLMVGRTSFVIAHRLSTIAHADRIVVMEDGRIIETGTHAELMARDAGRYQKMVLLQTETAYGIKPPIGTGATANGTSAPQASSVKSQA